MEKSIFNWEQFDEIDDQNLQFYNCTFVRDFGPFKTGQNVSTINIEFSTGKIDVYLDLEDTEPAFSGTLRFELNS